MSWRALRPVFLASWFVLALVAALAVILMIGDHAWWPLAVVAAAASLVWAVRARR
jgi:hypothetical protein